MSVQITRHEDLSRPEAFTRDDLGWVPWLEPVSDDQLTERQLEALVQRPRRSSPYFRLLADDPDILEARTLADLWGSTSSDSSCWLSPAAPSWPGSPGR